MFLGSCVTGKSFFLAAMMQQLLGRFLLLDCFLLLMPPLTLSVLGGISPPCCLLPPRAISVFSLTFNCHLMHLLPRLASLPGSQESLLPCLLGPISWHFPNSRSTPTVVPHLTDDNEILSSQAPGSKSLISDALPDSHLLFKSCPRDIPCLVPGLVSSSSLPAGLLHWLPRWCPAPLPSHLRPVQSDPDLSLPVLSPYLSALLALHSQRHLLCCSRNSNSVHCF